jgi:hypothetical protein
MASTVGIHFGARRLQLIQLDGSPKKPKFIRALEGLCPAGEGDEEARFTAGLKLLLKQDKKGWSDENVRVSVPADLGVFRHLSLPFAEKAKIEEVLKFEVESEIPQWDVDDLVCDFITTWTRRPARGSSPSRPSSTRRRCSTPPSTAGSSTPRRPRSWCTWASRARRW